MRSRSVLQRRLLNLESTFKVPDQQQIDNRVVAEALSNLSMEDLLLLRDGANRLAADIPFEASPEYDEAFRRANTLCFQALAARNASRGTRR